MKNEKGSVLSVAIIVVMLLSFSITTITAYTQNVANQTNSSMQTRDETIISDAYLREVMKEFRDQMEFWQNEEGYENLEDLYDDKPVVAFIEGLESKINELTGDILSISSTPQIPISGEVHLEYTFEYTIKNLNETLIKKTIISIISDDGNKLSYSDPFNANTGIIATYFENNVVPDQCTQDYVIENGQHECEALLISELDGTGGSGKDRVMPGNFYYFDDYEDYGTNPQKTEIDLNGHMLIIDGNMDLGVMTKIENGLIVVSKDLIITKNSGVDLELNNVLILVKGNVNLTLTHNNVNQYGNLKGSNYSILSYNNSSSGFSYDQCDLGNYNIHVVDTNMQSCSITNQSGTPYYLNSPTTGQDNQVVHYLGDKAFISLDDTIGKYLDQYVEDSSYALQFFN